MKPGEAQSVGEIIARILDNQDSRPEFDRQKACWLWGELLGPTVNRLTTRRYISGTQLHVYISSGAIKNELMYMLDPLVKRINETVGANIITKIILH